MMAPRQRPISIASCLGLLLKAVQALNAVQWSQRSIYQVITDRFALTDGSAPDCWIRSYCGGTWKGLEKKLDYIQGMGFDAVWISPVVRNIEGNTTWGYAYHGYWADDPFTLNEHFGTPDDLRSLSAALHARNMFLMVDVVINHLAAYQNTSEVNYTAFPSPFNTATAFHPNCHIDYANQTSVEDCWLVAASPPLLADITSENATVFDAMVETVVQIVRNYSIDGIRLDAARHIPKQHLRHFQDAVGVFVTGEAANESAAYVSQYQGPLQSVLNYPLWYVLQDTFVGRTTFDYLAATVRTMQAAFSNYNALANFIDNHDQPRLASRVGDDLVRDMNAAAFLLLSSGIPVVYYGFEQRFSGSGDPDNREPMWESGYDTSTPLYKLITRLHAVRKMAAEALGPATFYASPTMILATSRTHMAFQRGPLVVVVSNEGSPQSISEPDAAGNATDTGVLLVGSAFADGEQLVDLLSCQKTTATSDAGGFLSFGLQGMPRVWHAAGKSAEALCRTTHQVNMYADL